MVILFCVFVVQLGVAVACLGLMSPAGVEAVVTKGLISITSTTFSFPFLRVLFRLLVQFSCLHFAVVTVLRFLRRSFTS